MGKTTIIAEEIKALNLDAVDLLVFHRNQTDASYFPEAHSESNAARFHEVLLRLVDSRLVGEVKRPLLLVVIGIEEMRDAKLDVLRVARYAHELNAYLITEDKSNLQGWRYDDDFTDIRPSTVVVERPGVMYVDGHRRNAELFHRFKSSLYG